MNFGFDELKNLVIERGLCTVCGTCIGICPQECLSLVYQDEEPLPVLKGECASCGLCYKACPGSDVPLPELERFCFGKVRENKPNDFGVFSFSGMGYATDEKVHRAGSGGGVATALLTYGMEHGLIDCALVAGFSVEKPWRTEARLATTPEELKEAAKSKYAVVATNSLLGEAVKRGYKSIGLIGCPCHIEAIRKMEYQDLIPNITKKIKILVGLFCGGQFHFEGTRHALTELCHVQDLQHIVNLEYRGRDNDWSSNFVVELDSGERERATRADSIFRAIMHFTRERCAMCIDWSAELADISIGDYWGPLKKPAENECYSSVLVRTARGAEWLQGAQVSNYINLKESSADYLLNCGAFEIKKHGAVFRLAQRQRYGWPTPNFHCCLSHAPLQLKYKELE